MAAFDFEQAVVSEEFPEIAQLFVCSVHLQLTVQA